jgi:hypothetical protein
MMLTALALANLLSRMSQVNANLHTYTATLHADVHMLTFPFLQTEAVGTLYRKEPDRERLMITSGLPLVAQQFGNLYPRIVSPSQWNDVFVVTGLGDDGTSSRLRLVPRKRGNVQSIDATVNDHTALVQRLRWNYRNGGWAEMTQRYASIDGEELAVAQQGHIEEPGYVADISATLDDYRVNAPLSDSIFEQQ